MSDSEPTTPKRGPPPPDSTDTDAPESSPADSKPRSRSRSQARRQRRQKQQKSSKAQQKEKQAEMPAPQEEPEVEEQEGQATAGAMQPFEHIGPDSTSMDGPVTYARAQRGEVPMREGKPGQSLKTGNPQGSGEGDLQPASQVGQMAPQQGGGGGGGQSDLMKQDGLKLRLDLNLDIELELKAKIYGDLTLALL